MVINIALVTSGNYNKCHVGWEHGALMVEMPFVVILRVNMSNEMSTAGLARVPRGLRTRLDGFLRLT